MLLDESKIGKPEPKPALKCELCGLDYVEDEENDNADLDSIEETGRCIGCYEEWGDEYPDRV